MRVFDVIIAGLVGLTPGLIIFNFTGENFGIGFIGLLVGLFGLIAGIDRGWKNKGWLTRGGLAGAVVGLIPGAVLWPLDLVDGPIIAYLGWNEVAFLVTAAGFLIGLAIGNRRGARRV